VERPVVVGVFEPILDTDPVAEEVPVFVALILTDPVDDDVPVLEDDILEVPVAVLMRLTDIGGDLDSEGDAVAERVAFIEKDSVALEELDFDGMTEREPVDEAVLVLVVLTEAVIVFVLIALRVRRDEPVPVFVMAMVFVECGEDEDDFVGGSDLVDVLVEVPVFVDNAERVDSREATDVKVVTADFVEDLDGADDCVNTTAESTRIRLSGGVELTRPIANNMRDQRMLFYIGGYTSFLGIGSSIRAAQLTGKAFSSKALTPFA
jgi:hypothetical protein